MLLEEPLGPWQALLMSPKGRNASRDGFVNLIISLNSFVSFGSFAILFCFSLIRRSLSIVTTWSQQCNIFFHCCLMLLIQRSLTVKSLKRVRLDEINGFLLINQWFSNCGTRTTSAALTFSRWPASS